MESSRRDLHNALHCTAFGIHNQKTGEKRTWPKHPRKRSAALQSQFFASAADPGVAFEPERPARAEVPKLQAGYFSFPARAASEGWYAPGPGVSVIISWASRRSSRIAANFRGLVLGGGGSAVSKPNFARKYPLESSRRDLHNALLCTVLNAQKFRQKSLKILLFFRQISLNLTDFR